MYLKDQSWGKDILRASDSPNDTFAIIYLAYQNTVGGGAGKMVEECSPSPTNTSKNTHLHVIQFAQNIN